MCYSENMVQYLNCAAVDAVSPSPRVSPSYKFVPTSEYISAMVANGWEVESQRTVRTRNPNEVPYAKHMVTMRKSDELNRHLNLGGLKPRFHLINSHNGSSSVQGFLGLFRTICSNGLVIGSSLMQDFRFAHTLKAKTVADTITDTFLTSHESAINTAERWAGIQLSHDRVVELCRVAVELRGINPEDLQTHNMSQAMLTMGIARRQEDMGNNLWSTFNRIQENMMQGGFRITGARRGLRSIKAISATIQNNRGLWDAAERIATEVGSPA